MMGTSAAVAAEQVARHQMHTDQPSAEHNPTALTIAVLVGSVRSDRFCTAPAAWITQQVRKREGLEADLIDLADYDLPTDVGGDDPEAMPPERVTRLGERLGRADAFIVVTPVYNRTYPASIKTAIDHFYTEWQLKPVGFVSYGASTGGLQAIDALRDVFTEFHAVTLRDAITFANFWESFDHDGRPVDVEGTDRLADGVLDQLNWWATTLREARTARPYPFGGTQ